MRDNGACRSMASAPASLKLAPRAARHVKKPGATATRSPSATDQARRGLGSSNAPSASNNKSPGARRSSSWRRSTPKIAKAPPPPLVWPQPMSSDKPSTKPESDTTNADLGPKPGAPRSASAPAATRSAPSTPRKIGTMASGQIANAAAPLSSAPSKRAAIPEIATKLTSAATATSGGVTCQAARRAPLSCPSSRHKSSGDQASPDQNKTRSAHTPAATGNANGAISPKQACHNDGTSG